MEMKCGLTERDMSKLQAAEIRLLSTVKNCDTHDKLRNEDTQ
jgi:hypothetical protein